MGKGQFWDNSEETVKQIIRDYGPRKCTSENWTHEAVKFKVNSPGLAPIAFIKLDDARNANGLTDKMVNAMIDACIELHSRPEVKVVVFTAGGAYFCTGGAFAAQKDADAPLDMPMELASTNDMNVEMQARGCEDTARLFYLVNTLPQFKVASIRGANMGAGNSLIAAMDYVVAPSKKCTFNFKEAQRGLACCMTWQGILSKVGVAKVRELTLVSEEIDSETGKMFGLVDEIADGGNAGSDELATKKGNEFAKKSDAERLAMKKTGPYNKPRALLDIPTGARDCKALQPPSATYSESTGIDADKGSLNFWAARDDVIKRCGRKGRPAAARLSKEMWNHESVQLHRVGQGMAVLMLTRPEANNAIDKSMLKGLLDALVELHKSIGKIRLVCIHAVGDFFCSGVDPALDDGIENKQLQQMLFLMYMLPMYTVGVVEGKVSGVGNALCSTFDRLMGSSSGAQFDYTGLRKDFGGEFMISRLGAERFEGMVKDKVKLSAADAKKEALVAFVFDDQEALKKEIATIADKCSKCAPNAVADSKPYCQEVASKELSVGLLHRMSCNVARRQIDPEFGDSLMAISIPGYVPSYNRVNAVLPPHLVTEPPMSETDLSKKLNWSAVDQQAGGGGYQQNPNITTADNWWDREQGRRKNAEPFLP